MAKQKDTARKTAAKAEAETPVGTGGETHQTAGGDRPVLTTQQGIPVADDQNSLKGKTKGLFHSECEQRVEKIHLMLYKVLYNL